MKNIIRWISGIVFFILSFIISLFLLPIVIFLIPPLDNLVSNKLNIKLSTKWKTIICIILFCASLFAYSQSDQYKKYEAVQEYNKTHPTVTPIPTNRPEPTVAIITPTVKISMPTSIPIPTKLTTTSIPTSLTEDGIKKIVLNIPGAQYSVFSKDDLKKVEINTDFGSQGDNPNIKIDQLPKIVNIYYKPYAWDEKRLMRYTADTSVAVTEKLLTYKEIGMVNVWVLENFTDQYGKSSEETAIRIGLKRETADKINWTSFKDMVFIDYNKLLNIADDVYIHPAVKKEL